MMVNPILKKSKNPNLNKDENVEEIYVIISNTPQNRRV